MKAEDRVLIKNLAHTAEIINTINGGMAQPLIRIRKAEHEWKVKVRVPGVDIDNIKIEVRDNQLYLFHVIKEVNSSDIELPFLISALTLSRKIDFDAIVAESHQNNILIHLPLSETASGYERQIEIFKK